MMESDWLIRMVDDVSNHSFSTMILFILVAVVTCGYTLRMLISLIYAVIDIFKELSTFNKRHRYKRLIKKGMKKQKETITEKFEKGETDSKDFKKSYSKTN